MLGHGGRLWSYWEADLHLLFILICDFSDILSIRWVAFLLNRFSDLYTTLTIRIYTMAETESSWESTIIMCVSILRTLITILLFRLNKF